MAALVKQYRVDFELTQTVEGELRSAGASDNLILQISRSRSRVAGKPVRPAGHTVVDRAHGPANTTRTHAKTSAKEFLSQADKYRAGSGEVRNEGKAAELYHKAAAWVTRRRRPDLPRLCSTDAESHAIPLGHGCGWESSAPGHDSFRTFLA
jgi:hypothetical protein